MIASRLACSFLLLAAVATGCTSSGQSGNAFVFLTVELFTPSGNTGVNALNSGIDDNGATIACARFRNNLKNPTVTAPTTLDNVTITSYTVKLSRNDGVGTPGPFTFNAAFTVPAGSSSSSNPTITGNTLTVAVIVVPPEAKRELSPATGSAVIVFKGQDGRGQTVETQGGITVNFVSGSDPSVSCPAPTT